MKEQDYQRKIIERLEDQGYYCLKLIKTNKNGAPDIIAFKNGEVVAVECKTPKGVLSELQKYRLAEMKKHGAKCYVSKGNELNKI